MTDFNKGRMIPLSSFEELLVEYPEIDGKEEARKALEKAFGIGDEKTKKQVTTKHYLTIQLSKGINIEWADDSFIIKGPFTCKIIDNKTIRIQNKRGLDNG